MVRRIIMQTNNEYRQVVDGSQMLAFFGVEQHLGLAGSWFLAF